ncbi:SsgA family sporulation/cell division regulator [Streptomyces ziwulingensis]|uniref:SsgA family sporulation/cell division regulator n=1 Tax=Streptomyces ziwulingensis TaxID=1045501 RepID=A0ABP9C8S6_9ACTN
MPVIEQYARVHVLTDADAPDEDCGGRSLPVKLRYDPGADPRSVCVALPGTGPASGNGVREWAFPRELLERGLRAAAGTGAIRVWPCGRVQTVVEFHSGSGGSSGSGRGCSVVQFETKTLLRFLGLTYAAETAAAHAEPEPETVTATVAPR